jgi:hypothetical protein
MAWVNRVLSILPGFGAPIQNDTLFQSVGNSLSTTGQQTVSLTGLSPTISKGYVRVKIYGGGGTSPLVASGYVILSDGTTFVQIHNVNGQVLSTTAATGSPYTNGGANTTPGGIDSVIPFVVDINVSQVSVLTTMTGTSPTAKMDLEISGTS